MTQEEKFLLLQDLCARLPYGTKCYNRNTEEIFTLSEATDTTDISNVTFDYGYCNIHYIQPYLRPMSSMTEEEKKELQKITNNKFYAHYNYISNSKPSTDGEWHTPHNNFVTSVECNKAISWLDEKHFDHRTDEEGKTLIEKGLALEAPEGMYNKKSNYETRR